MPRVVERLCHWTRKTAGSLFSLLRRPRPAAPAASCGDDLIYRLRHWPRIPSESHRVDTHRILCVMGNRPVNRRWILNNSSMDARAVDLLLRRLIEQGAVEVVDAGKFRPDANAA